jgi:hypothetical protein
MRRLIMAVFVALPVSAARPAVLDGVTLPDARIVGGMPLVLNGIGLRTYSFLGIRVYVAGLYLEHRSSSAESILHSPETKLLDIRFLRDVDAEDARKSWRSAYANNCRPPECSVEQRDVERFLTQVPSVHRGDQSSLLWTSRGVAVTFNGRHLGDIADTGFALALLRTFLGPFPPTARLQRELLGGE